MGFVSLNVYDVLGREVSTLVNEVKLLELLAVQHDGSNLSSGIYFIRPQERSGRFRGVEQACSCERNPQEPAQQTFEASVSRKKFRLFVFLGHDYDARLTTKCVCTMTGATPDHLKLTDEH